MRRRDFIVLAGGAATASVAWPLLPRAQQPSVPVVGFLGSTAPEPRHFEITAFQQGLKEAGFVDGQSVKVEYHWAEGSAERLPALVGDLVGRQVSVMALAGPPAALAAKAATTSIPLVFAIGADPVKLGLVASLNRPGGNITGVSFLGNGLTAKQLELLHEVVPKGAAIGVVVNPDNADSGANMRAAQAANLGHRLVMLEVRSASDIDATFTALGAQQVGGVVVTSDPFIVIARDQIVALAARHKVPAIYPLREFAAAGGLMSYGASVSDGYRQLGLYAGKILKGGNPAEMPVAQAAKTELVLNLKTAEALGLEVPPEMLMRFDEVFE